MIYLLEWYLYRDSCMIYFIIRFSDNPDPMQSTVSEFCTIHIWYIKEAWNSSEQTDKYTKILWALKLSIREL